MEAFSFNLSLLENFLPILSTKCEVTVQLNIQHSVETIGLLSIKNDIFDKDSCNILAQLEETKFQPRKRPEQPTEHVIRKQIKKSSVMPAKPATVFSPKQDFVKDPTQSKADVSSLINTLIKPGSNEKLFQCSFCTYQSIRSGDVKRHIEMKHLPPSVLFSCLNCSRTFKAKSDLKKHYIKVHGLLEPAAQAMLPS